MNLTTATYRVRLHSDKDILPKDRIFSLKAKVWLYQGPAAWHFITLPKGKAQIIKKRFGHTEKGWGSLRVQVKAGAVVWKTSIFADKKSGSYLLPLKTEIRKQANIHKGDMLSFELTIL